MAAALRHAARTLQRTSVTAAAAAAEQCPRLSQRLVHGGPSLAVTAARRSFTSSYTADIHANDRILNKKKKELYTLLADVHRSENCKLRWPDRALLRQLLFVVEADDTELELVICQCVGFMIKFFRRGLVAYLGYKAGQSDLFGVGS